MVLSKSLIMTLKLDVGCNSDTRMWANLGSGGRGPSVGNLIPLFHQEADSKSPRILISMLRPRERRLGGTVDRSWLVLEDPVVAGSTSLVPRRSLMVLSARSDALDRVSISLARILWGPFV